MIPEGGYEPPHQRSPRLPPTFQPVPMDARSVSTSSGSLPPPMSPTFLEAPETPDHVYPLNEHMKQMQRLTLDASKKLFKVVYTGLVTLKTVTARIPINKQQYLVLTNHHLLQYKSERKARADIDFHAQETHTWPNIPADRIVLTLGSIFAIHHIVSSPHTFRIEHIHPHSQETQALIITCPSLKECQLWVAKLRQAVAAFHITLLDNSTLTDTERFSVRDRLAKHNDTLDQDTMFMQKVIYKEKRVKQAADGRQPQHANVKEVFQPVLLAIGKFSLYLLPPPGSDMDKYWKSLERDRYGLLSIHGIQHQGDDDTFKVLVGQVGHPTRQLVLVSTLCEQIIHHLRQAIHAATAHSSLKTCRLELPKEMATVALQRLTLDVEDPFDLLMHAYCASLNLNRTRIKYQIRGKSADTFVLLPPDPVNDSPVAYSKYELLAILRALQNYPRFHQVVLAGISLKPLETWQQSKDDSWTRCQNEALPTSNLLANELYSLLVSCQPVLQKLDLTDCAIGKDNAVSDGGLIAIGLAVSHGKCCLRSLKLGKNKFKGPDLHALLTAIPTLAPTLVTLDVQEADLDFEQLEMLITRLLQQQPVNLRHLDVSMFTNDKTAPPPKDRQWMLSSNLMNTLLQGGPHRLVSIGLRGHRLRLSPGCLDLSTFRHVDLGYNHFSHDNVNALCRWIQTPTSFAAVEYLSLHGCHLDGHKLRDVLTAITKSGNNRVHLDAGGNPIWREVAHMPRLIHAFMHNEGPRSLALTSIDWEDAVVREFLDAVRDNQTLQSLDLSDMRLDIGHHHDQDGGLSGETTRVLAMVFERNSCLTSLTLSMHSTDLSAKSAKYIAPGVTAALGGLKLNRTLRHMDLTGLGIGDHGATALGDVLGCETALESLLLDNNRITIDGFRALSTAMQSNHRLITLPKPINDIRFQLQDLKNTIDDLTQMEKETQWFIMHSTGSNVKQATTQLLTQQNARQTAELNQREIHTVIQTLMALVERNASELGLWSQPKAQPTPRPYASSVSSLPSRPPTATSLAAVGVPNGNNLPGYAHAKPPQPLSREATKVYAHPPHLAAPSPAMPAEDASFQAYVHGFEDSPDHYDPSNLPPPQDAYPPYEVMSPVTTESDMSFSRRTTFSSVHSQYQQPHQQPHDMAMYFPDGRHPSTSSASRSYSRSGSMSTMNGSYSRGAPPPLPTSSMPIPMDNPGFTDDFGPRSGNYLSSSPASPRPHPSFSQQYASYAQNSYPQSVMSSSQDSWADEDHQVHRKYLPPDDRQR
ncbi:hypothetical protein DM01DRAFT_1337000 [Hesseltinella vesiculosa]|uniref:PH domain-containing protein n=1 Tax=Hesseltinella vesiculosa TaxID=101127 RepID=A0A1X2GEP4_9FUNG|nr:hypothetical protein DM01DRAFT_1337000 [Hesseltinella vesiculosa]